MKVLYGSLNRDLVSEVQRRCSKCLGSWQHISSLGWPWYNQDETSMHSLTVEGFEISSTGWSCPNSCCVRCSWDQSRQVVWKAVYDMVEDVFLPVWRHSKISCPSHEAARVQMVTVAFGGQSVTNTKMQWTESANKVWGNDKNMLVGEWQNMFMGCQTKFFPCKWNKSLKETISKSCGNVLTQTKKFQKACQNEARKIPETKASS